MHIGGSSSRSFKFRLSHVAVTSQRSGWRRQDACSRRHRTVSNIVIDFAMFSSCNSVCSLHASDEWTNIRSVSATALIRRWYKPVPYFDSLPSWPRESTFRTLDQTLKLFLFPFPQFDMIIPRGQGKIFRGKTASAAYWLIGASRTGTLVPAAQRRRLNPSINQSINQSANQSVSGLLL